jgi:hypothetical protein
MEKYIEDVTLLLSNLKDSGEERIIKVCEFLGYNLVKNPVNPFSPWMMFEHPDYDEMDQAIVAAYADDDLDENTTVRELRRRFSLVQDLQKEISASYSVPLALFIGKKRMVLFKLFSDNRDDRLDLSIDSVERVGMYATYFVEKLSKKYIQLEEDALGLGFEVKDIDRLFERELSTRFNYVIELYRKKIAEAIVSLPDLRRLLINLVTSEARVLINEDRIEEMVENESFKTVVGCVVDTIVLRQILRRFLEAYHGVEQFNEQIDLRSLGLGVGEGRMEDILNHLVEIYFKDVSDDAWKKTVQKHLEPEQMELNLFTNEEEAITSGVEFKNSEEELVSFYKRIRKQFELAYGGDLFAGSVSEVTNKIEDNLNTKYPKLMPKLWADTSTNYYNFRYEDLSPKFLQDQYEQSMSKAIQIKWNDSGNPIVFYGDDIQEQKAKGAFYTDERLVQYMVNQALGKELNQRLNRLDQVIEEEDSLDLVRVALKHLVTIRVIDMTCGGGSFLRGAFQYLAKSHESIVRIITKSKHYFSFLEEFPMLSEEFDGQCEWEKHILTTMIYGIDIDYKALIIASQTLTLSALRNWRQGENFVQLIGLTLIHQNALISPIPFNEREEYFAPYKKEIAELISLRSSLRNGDKQVIFKAEKLRITLQSYFREAARSLLGDFIETLHVEILEFNVPEIFFNEEGEFIGGGFDVTIGNPPWEAWKFNPNEYFEKYIPGYSKLRKQAKLEKERILSKEHPHITTIEKQVRDKYAIVTNYFLRSGHYYFQKWIVDGETTKGDANLYKVSLERAYQVTMKNGVICLVLTASLGGDKGATGLRNLLFNECNLQEYLGFTNKEETFNGVAKGEKFILVTFTKEKPTKKPFRCFFERTNVYDAFDNSLKFDYPLDLVKKLAPDTLSLLEVTDESEFSLIKKLHQFTPLGNKLHSARFRRELHSGDDSHLFVQDGEYSIAEGKNIDHFLTRSVFKDNITFSSYEEFWRGKEEKRLIKELAKEENLTVKELKEKYENSLEITLNELLAPADKYRVGVRDVAYATNPRTLTSSIIPPEVVTVNSMHVTVPYKLFIENERVKVKDLLTPNQFFFYVGFFNSYVLDFVIRKKVKRHVSIFFINQLTMPVFDINNLKHKLVTELTAMLYISDSRFNDLTHSIISNSDMEIQDKDREIIMAKINALVANIYSLTRVELINILESFTDKRQDTFKQMVVEEFDKLS